MVYSTDNEMYKLRAQDAKERQHWVNVLRLVSQSSLESIAEVRVNNNKNDLQQKKFFK
jgi:hypothetical protein